jgi:hypothetical protein
MTHRLTPDDRCKRFGLAHGLAVPDRANGVRLDSRSLWAQRSLHADGLNRTAFADTSPCASRVRPMLVPTMRGRYHNS